MTYRIRNIILLFLMTLGSFGHVLSQKSIDEVEQEILDLSGTEKLNAYHKLITLYLEAGQSKKALRTALKAENLAETIISPENKLLSEDEYHLKPKSYLLTATAYEQRGFFLESKESNQNALAAAAVIGDDSQIRVAEINIARLDSIMQYSTSKKRPFGNTISDLKSAMNKGTSEVGVAATLRWAEKFEEDGKYHKAIENYTEALEFYTDQGEWEEVTELRVHIAELYEKVGKYDEALSELKGAREVYERSGDSASIEEVYTLMDSLPVSDTVTVASINRPRSFVAPQVDIAKRSAGSQAYDAAIEEAEDMKSIAQEAENSDDLEKSLYYYKEYMAIEAVLAEQRLRRQVDSLEQQNLIENHGREVMLLKQNEELIQVRLEQEEGKKQNFAIGLILTAIVLISLYFMYSNKKRDHKKLGTAYDNLAETQSELENAQHKIKQLLDQQISGAVAEALLTAQGTDQVARKFVCVMFLDIRNFTAFAEKLRPEEIIDYQNNVFAFMIDVIIKHGGVVNQILGDGIMATFGAPVSSGNDCLNAYEAARRIMVLVREKSEQGDIPNTHIGIGLHAGHVVTGNVGTEERKQYSITGNTVIIAARLEQLNKEFGSTLVVSKDAYEQLPADQREDIEYREVVVKGQTKPVEVAAFFDSKENTPTVVSS